MLYRWPKATVASGSRSGFAKFNTALEGTSSWIIRLLHTFFQMGILTFNLLSRAQLGWMQDILADSDILTCFLGRAAQGRVACNELESFSYHSLIGTWTKAHWKEKKLWGIIHGGHKNSHKKGPWGPWERPNRERALQSGPKGRNFGRCKESPLRTLGGSLKKKNHKKNRGGKLGVLYNWGI